MKKTVLAMLVASMPGMSLAATSPSTQDLAVQVEVLQQQVKALQQSNAELSALKQQLEALQPQRTGDAGPEQDKLKQDVSNLQIKVDALSDAADTGPIAGLSVTGYVDPMYLYNRDTGSAGFRFLNKNNTYDYFDSNLGDVYLDIKKTFGVGSMAPSAELILQPERGSGVGSSNERGLLNNGIFTQADVSLPLTTTSTLTLGLMPSLAGYEPVTSNTTMALTHNLLYDFSEPGAYLGVNYKWFTDNYRNQWQVMLANEQLKTAGAIVQGPNGTSQSNSTPTLSGRWDYFYSTALDLGLSGNIGRQTLFSPCTNGQFGYQCSSNSAFGNYFYVEGDLTYTTADIQYNAQIDYGRQQRAAWNGGTAQWYGFSLLANKKWNSDSLGRMGATVRVDYLNDSKNGGGGGGIFYGLAGNNPSINPTSGFGVDQACLSTSSDNGLECKGTNRADVALDLQFFPTEKTIVKLEYRHDFASNAVFSRRDGTLSKNNDILGTQFIYSY